MRKLLLFLLLSAFSSSILFSQDSVAYHWKVSSIKKADGLYTLQFSTGGNKIWDLFAPDASFDDIGSGGVQFSDSSILTVKPLSATGEGQTISTPLFPDKQYVVYRGPVNFSVDIRIEGTVPAVLLGTLQFTYGKGESFYPLESWPFEVALEGGVAANNKILIPTIDIKKPLQQCGKSSESNEKSLFTIFVLGFLGGLVALLTPCVFPMIPLTVSFFTKKAGKSNAILYGTFIFLIYSALSIPFHIIGTVSPTIYNDIATNIYLNVVFFIIFIVFAISFFGYFEITLPGSVANRANARQGSNLAGIFFMALTLVIVSFSCTGPILGTLLVGSASEGAWPLTAGLAGFGLALGLPFALFALFPHWLQNLPKSGGWLNTVKVVLGFIELALALKFLSNADLVAHWGLLKRELFFALWVVIFLGLFIYLMGWLRFPHDDPSQQPGLARKLFAFFVLAFTLFILPGVTNTRYANIGLVSGFPPPHCYSVYSHPVNCEEPLKDYAEALKLAKETNKPVMIDFTGWACVNCRKMEENVWPDPEVKELMEKYVLVSLYVDDKKQLPAAEQFVYTAKDSSERKIRTVGDKWSTFQTENFTASSQPWYVLISNNEILLTPPVGYTPDKKEFSDWLRCGLNANGN